MATRDDVFPSKFLKAADLKGKSITATIESAPLEMLKNPEGKEQLKTVLYFKGARKALPLNMTNWDSVAEIAGEDSDSWPGHQIELYPDKTQIAGKTVDCVRVRPPAQRELPKQKSPEPKAPLSDEMDDNIPF
jgi:hypothetical protein